MSMILVSGASMIFSITINKVPTLFIKAFAPSDVDAILQFVRQSTLRYKGGTNEVLFIDTPITSFTVEAVERLLTENIKVVFRDHHGIDGSASNEREKKVLAATAKLKKLLGDDACLITVRRLHPACSSLVKVGEFKDAIAIIADPDADGLTAAMKASGISYDGLDEDAAKLDGEPQLQVTGTPISQLLAKGVASIPSFDASKPKERETAYHQLFSDWLKSVGGDAAAMRRLEAKVSVYDEAVEVSKQLSDSAQELLPGVIFVDVAGKPLYDPGTLHAELESKYNCLIIVLRKSLGPLAALHGVQYSLSVAKQYQNRINLHDLLSSDTKSDLEAGVISNVTFLLHVSEDVWKAQVLPRLKAKDFSAV